MQKLQPHMEKIQKEHKNDKERQTKEILELYKTHQVNPLSSLLPMIVQIFVFIALYRVFSKGTGTIPDQHFLKFIDLTVVNYVIAGCAVIAQYLQGYVTLPKIEKGKELSQSEKLARNMLYFGLFITVPILFRSPAALGIYWLTNGVFSIVQQIYINKTVKVVIPQS